MPFSSHHVDGPYGGEPEGPLRLHLGQLLALDQELRREVACAHEEAALITGGDVSSAGIHLDRPALTHLHHLRGRRPSVECAQVGAPGTDKHLGDATDSFYLIRPTCIYSVQEEAVSS